MISFFGLDVETYTVPSADKVNMPLLFSLLMFFSPPECILSYFCAHFVLYVSENHKENRYVLTYNSYVVCSLLHHFSAYKTQQTKYGEKHGPLMSVINFDFKLFPLSYFFFFSSVLFQVTLSLCGEVADALSPSLPPSTPRSH